MTNVICSADVPKRPLFIGTAGASPPPPVHFLDGALSLAIIEDPTESAYTNLVVGWLFGGWVVAGVRRLEVATR